VNVVCNFRIANNLLIQIVVFLSEED
jgi:hypothetical protein